MAAIHKGLSHLGCLPCVCAGASGLAGSVAFVSFSPCGRGNRGSGRERDGLHPKIWLPLSPLHRPMSPETHSPPGGGPQLRPALGTVCGGWVFWGRGSACARSVWARGRHQVWLGDSECCPPSSLFRGTHTLSPSRECMLRADLFSRGLSRQPPLIRRSRPLGESSFHGEGGWGPEGWGAAHSPADSRRAGPGSS